MPTHREILDLPYSPEQVFAIVADIENYPRFLPHVISARINRRDGNTLWVDQLIRLKMLPLAFSTRAVLAPHAGIDIACSDSPFGNFTEAWRFAASPTGGTHLTSTTEYTITSPLMRRVMGGAYEELHHAAMRGFAVRARALYGKEGQGLRPHAFPGTKLGTSPETPLR